MSGLERGRFPCMFFDAVSCANISCRTAECCLGKFEIFLSAFCFYMWTFTPWEIMTAHWWVLDTYISAFSGEMPMSHQTECIAPLWPAARVTGGPSFLLLERVNNKNWEEISEMWRENISRDNLILFSFTHLFPWLLNPWFINHELLLLYTSKRTAWLSFLFLA